MPRNVEHWVLQNIPEDSGFYTQDNFAEKNPAVWQRFRQKAMAECRCSWAKLSKGFTSAFSDLVCGCGGAAGGVGELPRGTV